MRPRSPAREPLPVRAHDTTGESDDEPSRTRYEEARSTNAPAKA